MALTQEACPNCGAPVHVPVGILRMKCPFCSMTLVVERQNGEIALEVAGRITGSLERTSAQTQATIQEGTYVTQAELRRLQVGQDLSMAQMRLANVQSEIRSLQRSPQTAVTRNQMRDLRSQEAALMQQVATLQNILYPQAATEPGETNTRGSAVSGTVADEVRWMLFSFEGRASRRTFWMGAAVTFVLFLFASLVAPETSEAGAAAQTSVAGSLVFMVTFILLMWVGLATAIKRYHDRGKPGWWVLIGFIPVIGILWMMFELGFMPGTPGPNRYG